MSSETTVVIVAVVVVVLLGLAAVGKRDRCPMCTLRNSPCVSQATHIANVGDPLFNVREASKQCLALEDHLENAQKRCMDCIRKHFLLIELFLEEAIGLDRTGRYQSLLQDKPERVRRIIAGFNARHDYIATAQQVRELRKQFVKESFEIN